MKKTIQLLNRQHVPQYKALLLQAYGGAIGFTARPEVFEWYEKDERYPYLGLFHDDQLVSMMRLEWVQSWPELDSKMNATYRRGDVTFPVAYLTKAATATDFKGQGHNAILRYYSIRIALNWGVSLLFGTMIEDSPRVFSMQEMGYEFTVNPKKWNGYFISDKSALIACLDLTNKGQGALHYIEKNYAPMLAEYQLEFDLTEIKLGV